MNEYQKQIYKCNIEDDKVKQKLLYLLDNGITPEIFAQAMESIAEMFYVDVKRMDELEMEIDNLETDNKNMVDALEDIQNTARRAIP